MIIGGTVAHSSEKHITDVPKYTSGTYTGDNTANKAIAHGMGTRPKAVLIWQTTAIAGFGTKAENSALWVTVYNGTAYTISNTATDATNFYVGAVGSNQYLNAAGETFYWMAFY